MNNDRQVVGRKRGQGVDDAIHQAALAAKSVGRYEIAEISVGTRPVVSITVHHRADEVAQTSDGRVLKRQGGRCVAVFGRDLWEMMSERALARYEHSDSHVTPDQVPAQMANELAHNFGWSDPDTFPDRWLERQLLHGSGNLTVAGALVLTDPEESLGAAKFHVDLRSYDTDEGVAYIRREAIGGPAQHQVQYATDWVIRDVGTEMVVTGAFRHDVSRLPRRVVREVIANAVAHRDYSIDRTPVVVRFDPAPSS